MATGRPREHGRVAHAGLRRLSLALPNSRHSPGSVPRRRYSINLMETQCAAEGEVGNLVRERSASLSGDDDVADQDFLSELKEQALNPIKEDLADWLAKTLDIEITADNFLDVLDNGVDVCRLAKIIEQKAQKAVASGEYKQAIPSGQLTFRSQAKSSTWFARDNTANFINWCKEYGVKRECLFETEGLVLHKEPRTVILCLLELARLGAKFGLEPPNLVSLECEIEREEGGSQSSQSSGSEASGSKSGQAGAPRAKRKGSSSSAPSSKGEKLDTEVIKIVGNCKCKKPYVVKKVSQGRYDINGRSMFVRLLKGRHVMVRVGGGWDTLEHYLLTHDPCKITEFKRHMSSGDNKFLHVKGKYKSS